MHAKSMERGVVNTILFPAVSSAVPQAIALTEKYEEDDQTGDSGMGTGSGAAEYLMRGFLPGMYKT